MDAMKKQAIRGLSLLLITVLLLSCVSFIAAAEETEQQNFTYVKGANNASDSYMAGKYYKNLVSLPLTGDNVTDLLAVALSQVGYMESDTLEDISGALAGSDNFTEYNWNMGDFGVGYGTGNYDWCASFVSFCLLQSRCTEQNDMSDWCRNHKGDANYIWREVGCRTWAQNLVDTGFFKYSEANGGDYTPKAGDLIFFRWSPEKAIGHIGIVVYADADKVYTVEGNTSGGSTMEANGGGVHFKSYDLDYSCIEGYGTPPYVVNAGVCAIDYSGANPTCGLYIATTGKYFYKEASVESEYSLIPAGTLLEVTEVVEGGLGGMLKAVCEIEGERVEGYIVNNASDRVIQLSTTVPPEPLISFLPFDETKGFVGGAVTEILNGEELHIEDKLVIEEGGSLSLGGWFGFDAKITEAGYYIDGDRESIFWTDGAILEKAPTEEQLAEGGENTALCMIEAELSELLRGKHEITFLLKLENGVTPVLQTVEFTIVEKIEEPSDEPTDDPADEPTDEPADEPTDKPTDEPTEQPTDAPITEPTDEPTEKPTDVDTATDASATDAPEEKSGCGSSIGVSAVAITLLSAFALGFAKKRRD